jgi:hypothetical protein
MGKRNEEGPKDPRAQKTYNEALEYVRRRQIDAALEAFKKADKQDGAITLAWRSWRKVSTSTRMKFSRGRTMN